MRVLFLQQQPCIRTLKYAAALHSAAAGIELGFAYQGQRLDQWYGSGDELFDRWWHLGDDPAAGLRAALDQFGPDVVHSHNLPDRLTVLALQVGGGIPVVHDSHDMQSLRQTPYEDGFPEPADPLALERAAVEGCHGLIAVSEEMLDQIAARYRLPAHVRCFPNYVLARDLPATLPPPDRPPASPARVVYQGTLSTNGGHYDLRDLFRAAVAGGVQLDIYPARPAPDYQDLAAACPGMRCLDQLEPRQLLQVLPEYDFGWAAFNPTLNAAHLDTVLPNKLYEYVGCGLPVLTMGHRAIARLVAERGIGLDLATIDDLGDQLRAADTAALRRAAATARLDLTAEANIGPVVDLYKTLVG